ncbi:MAG TPA: hypothetical protein PJ988_08350 [Anaerolinea sp.]|nr:hypothetical protein [Anaerolinea sp.]
MIRALHQWLRALVALAAAAMLAACGLALPSPQAQIPPTPTLPEHTPTLAPSDTPQPTPTPLQPAGMLWLANPLDGNLRIVEPVSGSVAVIIPTGMQPDQVQVGEGAAWALDRSADRVLRVNLEDYRVEAIIPIPQGETDSLRVGAGYVWVAITERPATNVLLPSEEFKPQGGVLRINPQTNQVDGYTAVGPVIDMVANEGSLWVLSLGQVETPLARVDPVTLQALSLRLEGTPDLQLEDSLAVTPNSLWLFSQSYGKLYRASHAGRLYAEVSLGQHRPLGPAQLLPFDGLIWLAAPWGSLVAVNPADNTLQADVPIGVALSGLSASGGALWAASALQGQVYRVDPAAAQVSLQVETGPRLSPTPLMTATPIQRAILPCEGGPYSRLAVGEVIHTLKEPALPQRLHKEPGKETDRTGWIQPGEHARILEGPACADGWVWWRVETLSGGYKGWAAEGDDVDYWLLPDS